MSSLRAIPRSGQRDERWANGAGSTTLVWREPDDENWRIRVSIARVNQEGPFSELPATRRTLVPLDGPMTLRFVDGRELHAARFGILLFDGAPAPTGMLPEGPTRDFNLMLRGEARGEVLPRTLVDSMVLTREPGVRWLVYLDSGSATIRAENMSSNLALKPRDAALIAPMDDTPQVILEGAGEIMLVRLWKP